METVPHHHFEVELSVPGIICESRLCRRIVLSFLTPNKILGQNDSALQKRSSRVGTLREVDNTRIVPVFIPKASGGLFRSGLGLRFDRHRAKTNIEIPVVSSGFKRKGILRQSFQLRDPVPAQSDIVLGGVHYPFDKGAMILFAEYDAAVKRSGSTVAAVIGGG